MRTLLQAPAAGAVGSVPNTLATPVSGLPPSSSSPLTPTGSTPPPTDTSSSTTSTPPPSPSSNPPPPSPSSPTPPPPSPSEPPPSPPDAAPPPPAPVASPPPPEASPPPPPAALPPPPPAPVPTTSPPPPPAVAPPPPDNAAPPPPSTTQAPPPPSAPPPRRSHATPPSSSPSPPQPAAQPTASPVAATPPPPAAHPTVDYAPPPPTRTSSTTATRSPAAVDSGATPPPSSSSGLSSGATAAVAVVVVIVVLGFAGMFVCLSKRRKRKQAARYYAGFAVPSYTPQHLSGEAPFLRPPSAPGSMNFSMGAGGGPAPGMSAPMSQGYGQQPWASSGNYSATLGSQGPARSVATTASGDLSVGNTKAFSFDELYDITGGFARENVLGEGGFGCVFKGTLGDGKVVAVKQLKGGGGQGEREFQAEVEIISRVHHRHLVSLVGYCIAEDHRLLVYDYVSNNTLHHHLHGRGRPVMDWPTRVKIAAGSARGLAYLHEDCHPRIIHRDIKSSNILLDDQFEAQVADFGLARLAENDVTHISTRVMGTFGYLAPEYASTGKLTEKSDVFSFGVVLLELITGRKPVDSSRPLGDESLVEWSRPLLNRAIENQEFDELVDPRLDGNFDDVEMFRAIEAAAACIRHSAARRPKMGQVVRVLDSLTDVDLSNGVQPGKSQMFNVANTADIRQFQRMAFGSQDFSSEYSQQSRSSIGSRRDF